MHRVLVIGDAHVDETQLGVGLERFVALGNKVVQDRPDYIIIIGDFLSLNCLSDWDRNKRKLMEHRRYHLEIKAGRQALVNLLGPMALLQHELRADHKKIYTPTIVYIYGNHENRLDRYFEFDPTFDGHVSLYDDLNLAEWGIVVVPYKQHYEIDGVSFTHIPTMSNGKAIGNPTVAQKALKLYSGSVVFGHTHTLDHAGEHRHRAAHLNQALCVGCFFEHIDAYAIGSRHDYWRGVVDLTIYSHNRFDFSTLSMSELKRRYLPPPPAMITRMFDPLTQVAA